MIFLSVKQIKVLLDIWHQAGTYPYKKQTEIVESLLDLDLAQLVTTEETEGFWAGLSTRSDFCKITEKGKAWFIWRFIALAGFLIPVLVSLHT